MLSICITTAHLNPVCFDSPSEENWGAIPRSEFVSRLRVARFRYFVAHAYGKNIIAFCGEKDIHQIKPETVSTWSTIDGGSYPPRYRFHSSFRFLGQSIITKDAPCKQLLCYNFQGSRQFSPASGRRLIEVRNYHSHGGHSAKYCVGYAP